MTEGSSAVYPSISVVLPAYNEEAVIAETVARTDRALTDLGVADFEILVIDDGSSDATAARASSAGTHVRVVSHRTQPRLRRRAPHRLQLGNP